MSTTAVAAFLTRHSRLTLPRVRASNGFRPVDDDWKAKGQTMNTHEEGDTMARAVSQGVLTIVSMVQSRFIQSVETAILGRQSPDATAYYSLQPTAVGRTELSTIKQIVEYLKALYR